MARDTQIEHLFKTLKARGIQWHIMGVARRHLEGMRDDEEHWNLYKRNGMDATLTLALDKTKISFAYECLWQGQWGGPWYDSTVYQPDLIQFIENIIQGFNRALPYTWGDHTGEEQVVTLPEICGYLAAVYIWQRRMVQVHEVCMKINQFGTGGKGGLKKVAGIVPVPGDQVLGIDGQGNIVRTDFVNGNPNLPRIYIDLNNSGHFDGEDIDVTG